MKHPVKIVVMLMLVSTLSAACTDNGDETPVEVNGDSEMKGPKIMESSLDALLHEV